MDKNRIFEMQNELYRNPMELAGAAMSNLAILKKSLKYQADKGFIDILEKLQTNLFISREYEHLLINLRVSNGKIIQSFYPIAHPSGLATKNNQLYLASTRNPNRIIEFSVTNNKLIDNNLNKSNQSPNRLFPSRIKYYPGGVYFHDLAFIDNKLYGNSVGLNGVLPIDLNTSNIEELAWRPKLSKNQLKKLDKANYLQINSIAAGTSLETSFFTASAALPGKHKPGDPNFPVDKTGVIFSGVGDIIAKGLTRPHSAKIYNDKIWVNNSGYGGFGFIENGIYQNVISFKGWTRGLHFIDNYAFIGLSRILPRFQQYAPGLNIKSSLSAVCIIDMVKMIKVGEINFPWGNQIFGIESMPNIITNGLLDFKSFQKTEKLKTIFYKY